MFKDGWVPPQVIAGKDVSNLSAAIAANAAAVAQLTDENKKVTETFLMANLCGLMSSVLMPRVLRFFGQWLITRKNSRIMEFLLLQIVGFKSTFPLNACRTNSQSNLKCIFPYPRVFPGDCLLTKEAMDSGYEIVKDY